MGIAEGTSDGCPVGIVVGADVVGTVDGACVGSLLVGTPVGDRDGSDEEGNNVGLLVGKEMVGPSVGDSVGD